MAVSRTSSVPLSALRYCSDKAHYFGLVFSLWPHLYPNKKTVTPLRVLNCFYLSVLLFLVHLLRVIKTPKAC